MIEQASAPTGNALSAAAACLTLGEDGLNCWLVLAKDPDAAVRWIAVLAVKSAGGPGLGRRPYIHRMLVERVADEDARVSRVAADILKWTGDRSSQTDIIALLSHPEAHVRRSAVTCLWGAEQKDVILAIEALQGDRDSDVRDAVAYAIKLAADRGLTSKGSLSAST